MNRLRERPAVALFASVTLLLAVIGTAVILASPSTALPVGITATVGDSMDEAVPQVVVYGPAGDLEAGDVAVFHSEAGWLRHELVERTSDGWITQGTAEPHPDQWSGGPGAGIEPVERSQVAGVVYAAASIYVVSGALVGLLALLAAGVLFSTRQRWVGPARARGEALVSAGGRVTSRLSGRDLSFARKSLVIALAVLVAVSGIVTFGPFPGADRGQAATSDDPLAIADFENGNYTNNQYFAFTSDNSEWSVQSDAALSGSAGLRYEGSGTNVISWKKNFTQRTPNNASVQFRINTTYSASTSSDHIRMLSIKGEDGSGGKNTLPIKMGDNNELHIKNTAKGFTFESGKVYKVKFVNIDYSNGNFDVVVRNSSGVQYQESGIGMGDSTGYKIVNVGNVKIRADSSSSPYKMDIDNVQFDGALDGVEVSGTTTDSDGNAVSDATIELLQSGSVVSSTTTNKSGSYAFSTVGDGDYTIRASADGYKNKSADISISGSPRTVDLTLFESGTFEREFQLGEQASKTYPPSLAELQLYRFDRAIEFPLPGGTTFKAGPGDWNKVTTTEFNAYGTASARLENGEPYRVDVVATSGPRSTRWESLGWRADTDGPDPFLITVGSSSDTATATPTGTSTPTTPTATPIGTTGGGTGPSRPGLNPPCDPFDQDDDGDLMSCPDGDGDGTNGPGPTVTYTESDGFGPRVAGECVLADGTSGVLVEYWDPSYETTSLTFNVSHENSSYAGERTFDTPAGYGTWCVADAVTGNASDAAEGALSGNYTQNGTTFNYTDDLQQSALFGGPIGGGGGAGETTTGQRVVGIGLTAGVGYLLVRRFTEFRLSSAVAGTLSRARSLVGGGS